MPYTKIFSASLLVILLLTACRKEKCLDKTNPSCSNYDPCHLKEAPVAQFNIFENIGQIGFEADTIWCKNPIVLWAKNCPGYMFNWSVKTEGYEWTSTDSMVTILPDAMVPRMPQGVTYTVTLKVTTEMGSCSGIQNFDSCLKFFYLWPDEFKFSLDEKINYLPIFGTYRGFKESRPNELVNVTLFDSVYTAPSETCAGVYAGIRKNYNIVRNLAYNNFSSENVTKAYDGVIRFKGASGVVLNQTGLLFYNKKGCYGSKFLIDYDGIALLELNNSNKILIKYRYWDTITWRPVSDTFEGIRIY